MDIQNIHVPLCALFPPGWAEAGLPDGRVWAGQDGMVWSPRPGHSLPTHNRELGSRPGWEWMPNRHRRWSPPLPRLASSRLAAHAPAHLSPASCSARLVGWLSSCLQKTRGPMSLPRVPAGSSSWSAPSSSITTPSSSHPWSLQHGTLMGFLHVFSPSPESSWRFLCWFWCPACAPWTQWEQQPWPPWLPGAWLSTGGSLNIRCTGVRGTPLEMGGPCRTGLQIRWCEVSLESFIYGFIFGCIVSLLLCGFSPSCSKRGATLWFSTRRRLLLQRTGSRAAASVVWHTRAWLLRGTWDLPGPGIKPVSPALAGRFLTAEPPGKPG